MSEEFRLEIVNPEKSFLSKDSIEVVVPAFEGEMGILKNHISIISFLKPGILKVFTKNEQENFYVEDGILEFKDNVLSILTSDIFSTKNVNREFLNKSITVAEKELSKEDINDEKRFILSQKVETLKSISTI